MTEIVSNSLSSRCHREWRKTAKKMRRKRIRQRLAIIQKKEEKLKQNSPTHLTSLAKARLLEEYELELQEQARKVGNEKWIKDEEEAQKLWREQQRLKNLAHEEKLKEQQQMREEWEAEQKKIQKQKEELEKLKKEEEKRQQDTMERINDFMLKGGKIPNELTTVKESNPGKELCSFFSKVGACRFGNQCSRNHQHPGISSILLFSNFYSHFTLQQSRSSEYDTDIGLEYEESDTYLHFKEFYNDVVPELKSYGAVVMVKVCCNSEYHLRGNVYAEYKTCREALIAYKKFHGRWYGGKQLNVEFVNIQDWASAVCGEFSRRRCPKGKSCNFLHVFKNPKNEFPIDWRRNQSSRLTRESYSDTESCRSRHWRWSESPEPVHRKSREGSSSRKRHREKDKSHRSNGKKDDDEHKKRKSSSRSSSSSSSRREHKKVRITDE